MYYRRKWIAVLIAFVGLIRSAFGMGWPRTLQGAWYVLRANQKWAPFPDNDPDAAREFMARFYALLKASEGPEFDPVPASQLEVEWWRAHRSDQHGAGSHEALVALYAYTYGVEPVAVREVAELRAEAMDVSDRLDRGGLRRGGPAAALGAGAARAVVCGALGCRASLSGRLPGPANCWLGRGVRALAAVRDDRFGRAGGWGE